MSVDTGSGDGCDAYAESVRLASVKRRIMCVFDQSEAGKTFEPRRGPLRTFADIAFDIALEA